MRTLRGYEGSAQFVRFLIVGVGGTIIDFGLLYLLKSFGFYTLLANTISYSCGLINNFYWNGKWTFQSGRRDDIRNQFGKYILINIIGLGLNNLLLLEFEKLLLESMDVSNLRLFIAKGAATGIVVFWNFFINKYWTFRDR